MGTELHSRIRCVTFDPSTSGRPRSSSTRSGVYAARLSDPFGRRRRLDHLEVVRLERDADELAHLRLVLDDEHDRRDLGHVVASVPRERRGAPGPRDRAAA